MSKIASLIFGALALIFMAAPAAAQSACPYIAQGAVLTAAQWNACFQNKVDVAGATTTINGVACSLNGSCTIAATAGSVTIGTTNVVNGTSGYVLYQNGASPSGTIGEYPITGSGSVVLNNVPTFAGNGITTAGIYGGSSPSSVVDLYSTSNGSPSGDAIGIRASQIVLRNIGGGLSLVQLGIAGATQGELQIASPTANAVSIVAAASASGTLTLPNTAGDTFAVLGTAQTFSVPQTITVPTIANGNNALKISGTLTDVASTTQNGVIYQVTSAGNGASETQRSFRSVLLAGYTGSGTMEANSFSTQTSSTGNTVIPPSESIAIVANIGAGLGASGVTTGANIGGSGHATGATINVGLIGVAQITQNSGSNLGVVGSAYNAGSGTAPQIGGWFSLNQTSLPTVSAALIADNGSNTNCSSAACPVALFQVNGTTDVSVGPTGGLIVGNGLTDEGAGNANATDYYAGGTQGLASKSCAFTTANVATGITLTIKGGIITGTTTC